MRQKCFPSLYKAQGLYVFPPHGTFSKTAVEGGIRHRTRNILPKDVRKYTAGYPFIQDRFHKLHQRHVTAYGMVSQGLFLRCALPRWFVSHARLPGELHPSDWKRYMTTTAHITKIRSEKFSSAIPESVLHARINTIRRVQQAVSAQYGFRYRVLPFGSTQYGVSSPDSDLDLVILDPDRPIGLKPGSKRSENFPKIYDMRHLGRTLRRAGLSVILQVSKASVPIVKFRDPKTGISCDINVNERLSLINTDLIRCYCDSVPVLRPMLATLKAWARPRGLNASSPRRGVPVTFSTYALVLMTIAFLQMRGLAPNLQAAFNPLPPNPLKDIYWLTRSKQGKTTHLMCDVRYHRQVAAMWASKAQVVQVDILLVEWLKYWAHEFDYGNEVVDICRGGIVVPDKMNDLSRHDISAPDAMSPHDVEDTSHDVVRDQAPVETELAVNQGKSLSVIEGKPGVAPPPVFSDDIVPDADILAAEPTGIRVTDPFIRSKNVAKNIGMRTIRYFRSECANTSTGEIIALVERMSSTMRIAEQHLFEPVRKIKGVDR